jgi:glutathione S-transferase
VKAKLYSIAVSHPARAAGLMLRHKGIDHEIVNLPPGSQRVMLRLHGFRGPTVPALRIDGHKVQGSVQISRALDGLQSDPPLFPTDPARRAAVEEAERWGEAELQPVPRRMFRWSVVHDHDLRRSLAETTGMPLPALSAHITQPVAWYFTRVSGATEETMRADLERLPAQLDRVDELIEAGVIDTEELNAADFQIGTTVRVLMNFPQLRPMIESRAAGRHAMRIAPNFGAAFPVDLPAEWLPTNA